MIQKEVIAVYPALRHKYPDEEALYLAIYKLLIDDVDII